MPSVAAEIFEVADEHELEKYDGVYTFLTFAAVVAGSGSIYEIEVECLFEFSVEVVFRYAIRKLKGTEQFLLVGFSSLHE